MNVNATRMTEVVCADKAACPSKEDDGQKTRIHIYPLKTGITRTKEFERKRLASFAVNVGTKCDHDCWYCSTGAMLRNHRSFKAVGEDPFGFGYAIIDPDAPERVASDAKGRRHRGLVQLCTIVDAWSPAAQKYDLGRRCLEAILAEPGWKVRILTKNAAVTKDFDLIEQHRDRVLVGVSITATPGKAGLANVLEPNASSIGERINVMRESAKRGLRTYAMFCPLLPGIADASEEIDELIRFAVEFNAEEIFVEPVNARGPGLKYCQEALELWGYDEEAQAVGSIRKQENWSRYAADLIANVQTSVRRYSDIGKLRFLLYPLRLTPEDEARIRQDDAGVVWLGRE